MSRITPTTAPAQIEHYILPSEGFVRLTGVLAVFPVSRSHFLAGVRQGRYPCPVRLAEAIVGWRVEDIRDLIKKAELGELTSQVAHTARRGPGRPRKTATPGLRVDLHVGAAALANFKQTRRILNAAPHEKEG